MKYPATFGTKSLSPWPPQPPTDADLWAAFQRGDEGAFRQLYNAHFRHLLNYGLRLSGLVGVVEDAIQELFLELCRYRQRLTPHNPVRVYSPRVSRVGSRSPNGQNWGYDEFFFNQFSADTTVTPDAVLAPG